MLSMTRSNRATRYAEYRNALDLQRCVVICIFCRVPTKRARYEYDL
jgi:hypothetical protein